MKSNFLLLFLFLVCSFKSAIAANGDTTRVRAFNKLDMNRYGNFDNWVKFPDGSKKYQKILMKYIPERDLYL